MIGRKGGSAGRVERNGFRWRGTEVSRVEALSDAVFGFAITLLVMSLEVPRTYAQLMSAMRGFWTFAVSFAVLFLVWHHQYRWFRRYGLEDGATLLLNALLLFVIVFFVYPLKFVFGLVVGLLLGEGSRVHLPDGSTVPIFTAADQGTKMMLVFGAGYVAVFGIFSLMYAHAWRRRHELELNEVERWETRDNLRETLLNVGVGVLSMIVCVRLNPMLGGLTYALVGPALTIHGIVSGAGRRRLDRRLAAESTPSRPSAQAAGG